MEAINPHEILEHLGIRRCGIARRVEGGLDTTIWRVRCEHGDYALRLFREGTAEVADRELATMQAVEAAGGQVPNVVAYGTWNTQRAMVMTWCAGNTVFNEFKRRPWAVRNIGYQFGKAQAALHQLTPDLPDIPAGDWHTRLGPIDEDLRERLEGIEAVPARLLHLDYHPLNVMFHAGRVGCILDWQNASIGDFRADVARTWSILRLMPLPPSRAAVALEQARKLLAAGWLRGYQETAGNLGDMDIFKLWAATSMVTDLKRHIGKPEVWFSEQHIETIQRRVDQLRSGLNMD